MIINKVLLSEDKSASVCVFPFCASHSTLTVYSALVSNYLQEIVAVEHVRAHMVKWDIEPLWLMDTAAYCFQLREKVLGKVESLG